MVVEYTVWGGMELVQAALGCVWVGVLLSFAVFFYSYWHYKNEGVNKNNRNYLLAYQDLKKVSKRIVGAFAMFLVATYCLSFASGFNETIVKGSIVGLLFFPPMYWHFNDETKYQFHINKGD